MPDAADEERVGEQVVEPAAGEGGTAAAAPVPMQPLRRADAGSIELGLQPEHRAECEIAREDLPHQGGLLRHRLQAAPLGAVADRHHAPHPHALRLGGGDLVADPLGGDLAFELREGEQHVQRQPAHRGGGVEGLGHRDEGDPGGVEDGDDAGEVGERAGQPIDLVDDHDIDCAGLDVGQQLAKAGAVHRAAGEAAVVVGAGQGGPALVLLAQDVGFAGLALGVERVERLLQPLLGALAGVDRAAALPRGMLGFTARLHRAGRRRRGRCGGCR